MIISQLRVRLFILVNAYYSDLNVFYSDFYSDFKLHRDYKC